MKNLIIRILFHVWCYARLKDNLKLASKCEHQLMKRKAIIVTLSPGVLICRNRTDGRIIATKDTRS